MLTYDIDIRTWDAEVLLATFVRLCNSNNQLVFVHFARRLVIKPLKVVKATQTSFCFYYNRFIPNSPFPINHNLFVHLLFCQSATSHLDQSEVSTIQHGGVFKRSILVLMVLKNLRGLQQAVNKHRLNKEPSRK